MIAIPLDEQRAARREAIIARERAAARRAMRRGWLIQQLRRAC